MMYKIANGLIAVPSTNLIPADSRTRAQHSFKYRTIESSTSAYKNSFFPRTIPGWNRLPSEVVNSDTVDSFKANLERVNVTSLHWRDIPAREFANYTSRSRSRLCNCSRATAMIYSPILISRWSAQLKCKEQTLPYNKQIWQSKETTKPPWTRCRWDKSGVWSDHRMLRSDIWHRELADFDKDTASLQTDPKIHDGQRLKLVYNKFRTVINYFCHHYMLQTVPCYK